MLLKSHALPLYQEKICNSAHEQTPLSIDTISYVIWHQEVGQAKDFCNHQLVICYHSQLPWKIILTAYLNDICLSICDQYCCDSSQQERAWCTQVSVWEHCALNYQIFWCGRVYFSTTIIITTLK
jgi:hypothetical protein